jgi:hypothetical protein
MSNAQEDLMNLWDALGISPQHGILGACACLAAALVLGAGMFLRKSRAERKGGLRLDDD